MNTKQLLLSLLMSIMSVSAFAEDVEINGITYSLNNETLEAEVIDGSYSGDITIPETVDYNDKTYSVTSIGEDAFRWCYDLTSITIPNSVTSIGYHAFWQCYGLTELTIPNSVTSIGEHAFEGCDGLTSITIPSSVTSIGNGAFSYCYGLESIIVENGNTIYDSRDNCNAIIETETNTLIAGCKNTVIPNSITSIGDDAFDGCLDLTSITIPSSVTSIGNGAFSNCKGLTSVTIGNSVTSIDDWAFCGCTGLTSITIPNSVTTIGDYAFCGCGVLTSITIPNSVTSIGRGAFDMCSGLASVTIGNSVTSIGESAFSECSGLTSVISLIEEPFEINENTFEYSDWVENNQYDKVFTTATLYVPAGTKSKYESTPAWNKFKNIVEGIENAVKSVETDAKTEETLRYNVSGQRISSPQKGLNVVKMSDGTTRKVMCK